ncbi:MAG TPA: glycosyltransferase [Solirubrobacteraceae bacterium]|nr:glycosyltransferase [Solirubrobacteraceae bacterium]
MPARSERSYMNALDSRDFVCVGFNDWDNEVWTNQHHLMARFAAAGSRVLFIESLGLRRPQLGSGRDVRRIGRRLRHGLAGLRHQDGVAVLSPLVVPVHGYRAVSRLNAILLRAQVTRSVRRLGFSRPILWGYVPQAQSLIEVLDPRLVVYHCVDDIGAQDGVDPVSFAAAEQRFAQRADLVLASAPALTERMRRITDNVLYVPNVADTRRFSRALERGPVDAALAALPEPRIVFVGAISSAKLDFEILRGLAAARRDWTIALVGPIGLGDPGTDVSTLTSEPNIHLLGPRDQDELPNVLRGAAAGLIPYVRTRLTASIFPMKVYEYLAAGLPVVTSPLPALEGLPEVTVADGVGETVAALERLLAEDSPALRCSRSQAAQAHSWDARLAEIDAALTRCQT